MNGAERGAGAIHVCLAIANGLVLEIAGELSALQADGIKQSLQLGVLHVLGTIAIAVLAVATYLDQFFQGIDNVFILIRHKLSR